ncbi:ATP-binding protein [Gynuella sunshinyii]|uniref:Uncharacterized protein n=1 Tax=Gynuella sunshinyii YC6258 TaxID=1445510 RepID=A0A0C5W4L4_9GAMM|nr:ATP-binding protein [Gynuella sunshinyii]AJQ97554.1 hypothetical Protein YC6258_05526 [Gynuella sunshinyii YC6258]
MSRENVPYVFIPIQKRIDKKPLFIGRQRLRKKLRETLIKAFGIGGCFLVGGYRGVGKTSLVNQVLEEIKKRYQPWKILSRKPLFIRIDLGVDSGLSIRDILCDLVESTYVKTRREWQHAVSKRVLLLILMWVISVFYGVHISGSTDVTAFVHNEVARHELLQFTALISGILCFLGLCWIMILRGPNFTQLGKISQLVKLTRYARMIEMGLTADGGLSAKIGVRLKQSYSQEPISARRIQQELTTFYRHSSYQYIVVLDEVDKINPAPVEQNTQNSKTRKAKVDELLGGLKSLLNGTHCIFIIIAGREMVDAYYSESGYTSVLYEGVFKEIFEVPTLLTDGSDHKLHEFHSMVKKYINSVLAGKETDDNPDFENMLTFADSNENHNVEILDVQFFYELFVKFITLHSWGNIKRMSMMVQDHIEWNDKDYYDQLTHRHSINLLPTNANKSTPFLFFTPSDIRKMFVSAKLYSLYSTNIGRLVSRTHDKSVVSSFISILDVVRFHSQGFSRAMLDRTVAGIDVHSETNLAYVADELVNSTFQSIIRRTASNLFPYRFYITTDLEFSYLSKSLGAKSSSFEFALDSAEPVRAFYIQEVENQKPDDLSKSSFSSAKLQSILGDIYASEQSYDMAFSYYANATFLLKKLLRNKEGNEWRLSGGISLEAHYTLIQVLLKKGLLEEIRENNAAAMSAYREAELTCQENFYEKQKTELSNGMYGRHKDFDNNLQHTLLAQEFLALKSGKPLTHELFHKIEKIKVVIEDPTLYSKTLLINYFAGNYQKIINKVNPRVVLRLIQFSMKRSSENVDDYFRKYHISPATFIYAQSIFSLAAQKLKKNLNEVAQLNPKNHTERYQQAFAQWSEPVLYLLNLSGKLSNFENLLEDDKNNKWQQLTPVSELTESEMLERSFKLTFLAADNSRRKGRYAEAAHQYISLLLNWIALLEIFPWSKCAEIETSITTPLMDKIKTTPKWLNDLLKSARDCIEKSDRATNIKERVDILTGNPHFHNHTMITSEILERISTSEEQEQYSYLLWYRSNISSYLMIFGIWEHYCRYSINRWCRQKTDSEVDQSDMTFNFHIIPSPLGNLPRMTAIYLWIKARNSMHERLLTNSLEGTEECINEIAHIISLFSRVLDEHRKVFRSDDPDTFPPKSHVYFNIFELLEWIKNKTDSQENRDILSRVAMKLLAEYPDVPTMLLDPEYIRSKVERHVLDLAEIDNISSTAYRRKVRHKYYLYDDFEDPFYIGEWAFLQMLSSSSKLLQRIVKDSQAEPKKP